MLKGLVYYLDSYRKFWDTAVKEYPEYADPGSYVRYWPKWVLSNRFKRDLLAQGEPWIPFSALEFLEKILRKEDRVFEFGSGGSTVFLSKRAGELTSVEHDREWYAKVESRINQLGIKNCRLLCVEPEPARGPGADPDDPEACASHSEAYKGVSFKSYSRAIDSYPNDYFDLVLVDGRVRPSCVERSAEKVRPGGYLMLDDAERRYYLPAQQLMTHLGWEKTGFFGPKPNQMEFSLAYFWKKPETRL